MWRSGDLPPAAWPDGNWRTPARADRIEPVRPSLLVSTGGVIPAARRKGPLMAVSYTCPNPDCGVTLKTPNPVPPGKAVKCPKCGNPFVPEPEVVEEPAAAGPGTFKLADDPA